MERKSPTPSQALPLRAEAGAPPQWFPMWAGWCCGVPSAAAAMWALQMQQVQAAYQQGLEQGRREAAASYAAAMHEPGKN
jgi:hypothetical protein